MPAALVPEPGAIAEGSAAIREALRWFLDRGGRISLDTKLVLRVGDLAYLANRWSLTGATMPDGSPAELGATTAEVVRRQGDGTWLYVIDNAWGDLAA
jgi:ketosteroid isomerase-like protein